MNSEHQNQCDRLLAIDKLSELTRKAKSVDWMLESLRSVIAIVASLLGIIGGLLTVVVILRRRQLARPKLRLSIGTPGELRGVPKKLGNQLPSIMTIIPEQTLAYPLITYLLLAVQNEGKEALKNVRLVLEYTRHHFINNDLLSSIQQFEPTVLKSPHDPNVGYLIHSHLKEQDFKEAIKVRKSYVYGDRAQVSYEVPIIRPGEGVVFSDLLLLKGSGPDNFRGLGFGDAGFQNILRLLKEIKSLKDYFAISILVFAENHEDINSKLSVLRFLDGTDVEASLTKFREAIWLGESPRPGLYYSRAFRNWMLRKKKRVGRSSPPIQKPELGLLLSPEVATITDQGKQSFSLEIPEFSQIEYFVLNMPNCDYFDLPNHVDSFQALMKWLGFSTEPIKWWTPKRTNKLEP